MDSYITFDEKADMGDNIRMLDTLNQALASIQNAKTSLRLGEAQRARAGVERAALLLTSMEESDGPVSDNRESTAVPETARS